MPCDVAEPVIKTNTVYNVEIRSKSSKIRNSKTERYWL